MSLHCAVVVDPQDRDHVADVGLVADPARSPARVVGERRVGADPAGLAQLGGDLPGEAEMGRVIAMEVADLAPAEPDRELAALAERGLAPDGDSEEAG